MANKILSLFTIIAVASITSSIILGNSNFAYAGGDCITIPNPADVTLAQGESQTIQKQVSLCEFGIGNVVIQNDNDCTSQGIDVSLQSNDNDNNAVWIGDETITNTGGNPGTTTCVLELFALDATGGNAPASQTIRVTTSAPIVGGELIPIDSTSLLLAGSQSFSWMIPVVLSVLGIGLFVVSRKS